MNEVMLENKILSERVDELLLELAELKRCGRYACVHNRLESFDNPFEFIPISSVGDNELKQTIVEIQTGDEDLNVKLAELICALLNKGVL